MKVEQMSSHSMYLQEELDGLAANYPDRFKIYYVLNQVSQPSCIAHLFLFSFLFFPYRHFWRIENFWRIKLLFYFFSCLVLEAILPYFAYLLLFLCACVCGCSSFLDLFSTLGQNDLKRQKNPAFWSLFLWFLNFFLLLLFVFFLNLFLETTKLWPKV